MVAEIPTIYQMMGKNVDEMTREEAIMGLKLMIRHGEALVEQIAKVHELYKMLDQRK